MSTQPALPSGVPTPAEHLGSRRIAAALWTASAVLVLLLTVWVIGPQGTA